MKKAKAVLVSVFMVALSAQLIALPAPDIKHVTESKFEFKGTLGLMMRLFGGNKPVKTVTYLKGNVLRTDKLDKKGKLVETQILDLDREVLIHINHKEKQYTETSFDEWRESLEALRETMAEAKSPEQPQAEEMEPPDTEVKWDVEVDIDTPGDTKKIAGYKAEKVVIRLKLTADVKERDEETGEMEEAGQGGVNVIATVWLSKNVPGLDEMKAFQQRLAEKLGFSPSGTNISSMLQKLQEAYPQLAAALQRVDAEKEKLDGVPLESHTVFESWGESKQQSMEEEEEIEIPKSVGGLFKGLGKKLAKKKKKEKKATELLKTVSKTLELKAENLSADLFAIPKGYKLIDAK
ncbi:MAG: hypothetical protein Q9P14_08495 [candidate division KSB1 bacterium]|nr:hypothetical protein [candidate division KSB1 bacterium]